VLTATKNVSIVNNREDEGRITQETLRSHNDVSHSCDWVRSSKKVVEDTYRITHARAITGTDDGLPWRRLIRDLGGHFFTYQ